MNDFITSAINRILQLAEPTHTMVDDLPYTNQSLKPVHPPTPDYVRVHTLSALARYITENIDTLDDMRGSAEQLVCHVVSPEQVDLISFLNPEYRIREHYIRAEKIRVDLPINDWMPLDRMIMGLNSCFQANEHRDQLLQMLSGMRIDAGVTYTDDGTTQEIQTRSGIARVEPVSLPNPITLVPHSTFPEIEQPERGFIVRLNQEGSNIRCKLLEADNGAWRLTAMQSIAKYIQDNTKGVGLHILY
jgi:hypothetical protein